MAEKILVVDDEIDSLKLIGLMLQRQGYEISAASSGAQAISKAVGEKPDLIILDVMMPDMDGYEVCKRMRANPGTAGIPIIMFTAKSLVDDKVAGFEAGADDYLTKPTHPAELASRVRAVLARSAAQRRQTASTSAGDSSMMIGFLGAKGGVGTTTLAMNVASVLNSKDPAVLADIRMGQGSLGLMLGFGRSTGMANLLNRPINELNARTVENELVQHNSGLRLMLSSISPRERQLSVNPDSASLILKHLRGLAKNTVLDMGVGLSKHNVRLIKELDQIVLVVEPSQIAMSMAREMLRATEQIGISRQRTNVVVVNRMPGTPPVSWQEAEQTLNHEMLGVVNGAGDLAVQAATAGVPMVAYQPNTAFATQIAKLTEELVKHGRAAGPVQSA
jgi:CheY-like chemotaxis protein/MinD-like ATPase involved in chromosome partitioning or flagellar assembly